MTAAQTSGCLVCLELSPTRVQTCIYSILQKTRHVNLRSDLLNESNDINYYYSTMRKWIYLSLFLPAVTTATESFGTADEPCCSSDVHDGALLNIQQNKLVQFCIFFHPQKDE